MAEMSEEKLVELAKRGDENAMEALIKKYMWLPRSIARKYFLSSGSYDDLLQEGLIGLFKGIHDFDPEINGNLTGFLSMCIGSEIKDAVRRSTRKKQKLLSDASPIDDFDRNILSGYIDKNVQSEYIYDPVHNYIEREGVENFYKKLENLFEPSKIEILKYYLDGYTYVEISDITDNNVKKIDNILTQIKKKIKKNEELFLN